MAKVGVTIGRVNVKVFPDTSEFAKELHTQLELLERRVKVYIPTELKTDNLEREARQAVARLNAMRNTVEFETRLDGDSLEHSLRDAAKKIAQDETIEKTVRFRYDDNDFDEINRQIAKVDELLKDKLRVEVEVKTDEESLQEFRDRLQAERYEARIDLRVDMDDMDDVRRYLARLDEMAQDERRVDLDVSLENIDQVRQDLRDLIEDYDNEKIRLEAEAEAAKARAELAIVARDRIVNLWVNVNQAALARAGTAISAVAGGRLIGSTLDNLREMFENLDKNLPLVGSITLAIAGLSAWLLTAASNVFALSRSLAQMFGAALALPGILTGIGFGIGATVAVMKDFNAEMPEVGQAFRNLQDIMSMRFWSVARNPLREMFSTLLPQMKEGLAGTATSLGVFFGEASRSVSRHLSGSLIPMFNNLNASIALSSMYTEQFAQIVEILGRRGSEYLPRLAAWWGRLATRFAGWLEVTDRSGRLVEILELGIFQMREFGRAASNLGSFLTGLAKAAERAGGSTLSMFADTLGRMAKTVNGAKFQQNLTMALVGAHDAMTTIANHSGPAVELFFSRFARNLYAIFRTAGQAIGQLLDGVAGALGTPTFQRGLLNFFQGISDGVTALTPAFLPLGRALGVIGTTLGNVARAFGPLLEVTLRSVAEAAIRLAPSIEQLVEGFSRLLHSGLERIIPVVVGLADAFFQFLAALPPTAVLVGFATAWVTFKAALAVGSLISNFGSISAALQAFKTAAGSASQAAQDLGVNMGALGRVAKGAGIAALLAVAADMIAGWASNSRIAAVDTQALARSMENVADGSRWMGRELNQVFTNAFAWQGDVESAEQALEELGARMGAALGQDFDQRFVRWHTFGRQFQSLEERTRQLDAALSMMVNSGNIEQAEWWLARLAEQAEANNVPWQSFLDLLPSTQLALENVARAEREAAEAAAEEAAEVARAAAQVEAYNRQMQDLTGLTPGAINGINEASKAFIDFSEGLDGAEFSLEAWIRTLEKQVQAQRKWADNMAELSKRGMSDGLRRELEDLGLAGAVAVQALVDAGSGTDEALKRLEEVVKARTEGAGSAAETGFGQAAQKARDAAALIPEEARKAIVEAIPELETLFANAGTSAGDAMAGALSSPGRTAQFSGAGWRHGQEYVGGFLSIEGHFPTQAEANAARMAAALRTGAPYFGAGVHNGLQFGGGILSTTPDARSAGSKVGQAGALGAGVASPWNAAGFSAADSFGFGVRSNESAATRSAKGVADAAATRAQAADFLGAGRNLIRFFVDGLSGGQAGSSQAAARIARAAASAVGGQNGLFLTAGANAAAGFASGILSKSKDAINAAANMAARALAAARKVLDSHSPSREFMKLGAEGDAGFALGMEPKLSLRAASGFAESVLSSIADDSEMFLIGRDAARGYVDGIRSADDAASSAASLLRDGVVGELGTSLGGVTARLGDSRSSSTVLVSMDGAEMTLLVDGVPMRAIVRSEAHEVLNEEARDLAGRRGGGFL